MRITVKLELNESEREISGELSYGILKIPFSVISNDRGLNIGIYGRLFSVKGGKGKLKIFRLLSAIQPKKINVVFCNDKFENNDKSLQIITATIIKIDLNENKIQLFGLSGSPVAPCDGKNFFRVRLYSEAKISLFGIISAL